MDYPLVYKWIVYKLDCKWIVYKYGLSIGILSIGLSNNVQHFSFRKKRINHRQLTFPTQPSPEFAPLEGPCSSGRKPGAARSCTGHPAVMAIKTSIQSKYEKIWKNMEKIWKNMGKYRKIWKNMEKP